MKGAAATAVVVSAGGLLSACASQEAAPADAARDEPAQEEPEQVQEEPAQEAADEATPADGILVAYFSASSGLWVTMTTSRSLATSLRSSMT